MNKKIILLCFVASLVVTICITFLNVDGFMNIDQGSVPEKYESIIAQEIVSTSSEEKLIYTLYDGDKIIGILKDEAKLDELLDRVYVERYEETFPQTILGLSEDIHISDSYTLFNYEDKDSEILEYLDKNDMFSVQVNKVEFSNGSIVYVKNLEDLKNAQESFAKQFISEESYHLFKANKTTEELTDYAIRDVSMRYMQTATVSKGLASASKILKSKEEVDYYLSYGYEVEKEYYEVKEYDTVEGIIWLNGLTLEHFLSINQDNIVSKDQYLKPGLQVNITPLNSPIDFEIIREEMSQQVVYPGPTEYIQDDTLREGLTEVVQEAKNGSKNVKFKQYWVNGVIVSGELISELITEQPQNEIIKIGTRIEPKIGSGNFRWPLDNASVSCGWFCYGGHSAIDIQNRYNKYGNALAADRGVVIVNSYHYINGYYMEIDHGNGYVTYYGHLNQPGFIPVGTTVAQGEVIGQIGMTGLATGPHIHFEIRFNGQRLNPLTMLP